MLPHDSDWDHIATLTGDASWRARAHAPLCAARRGLPPPAAVARAAPPRHRSDRARLGRLAAHREADPARRRSATTSWCALVRDTARTFVAQPADAAGERSALAARRRAIRMRGPGGGGSFEGLCYTPLSTHRPSPHRRARAAARRARGASAIACTSSSMRWPRACCSTPTAAPAASSTCKGRRLYRAHAAPERRAPASGARCARGARSSCAAAPSTRRSC